MLDLALIRMKLECLETYLSMLRSALERSWIRFLLAFSLSVLMPILTIAAIGSIAFWTLPSGFSLLDGGYALSIIFESSSLHLGWPEALLLALAASMGAYSAVARSLGTLGLSSASLGLVPLVSFTACCTIAPAPILSALGVAAAAASSLAIANGLRAVAIILLISSTAYYSYRTFRSIREASEPLCSPISGLSQGPQ